MGWNSRSVVVVFIFNGFISNSVVNIIDTYSLCGSNIQTLIAVTKLNPFSFMMIRMFRYLYLDDCIFLIQKNNMEILGVIIALVVIILSVLNSLGWFVYKDVEVDVPTIQFVRHSFKVDHLTFSVPYL
jgi:hypothetical protein